MATATQIATRALRRLAVVAPDETPSALDTQHAEEVLDELIASWEGSWRSSDVLPLDARFEGGVIAILAERLAEDYGRPVTAILARDAERGRHQEAHGYLRNACAFHPRTSVAAHPLRVGP